MLVVLFEFVLGEGVLGWDMLRVETACGWDWVYEELYERL